MSGYLLVRTDQGRFGLRLADVIGVAVTDGLSPMPGSHRSVRGVLRVRQWLVPLVHLRALLTNTDPPALTSETCVLTRCAGRAVALEVSEVDALVREDPEPVPAGWEVPWAAGVARQGAEMIPVVDGDALAGRLTVAG